MADISPFQLKGVNMRKAVIDEILRPGDMEKTAKREANVRKNFWKKIKKTASRIPYVDEVVASYYCALDPQTPFKVRGTILAGLAYFILPLDLLPDFIAGFGLTDDITVLTLVIGRIREHITEAHRAAAKTALEDEETPDA